MLFAAGAILAAAWVFARPHPPRPLARQAYVWQRAWNEAVRDAIQEHQGSFSGLAVLGAEVTWRQKTPRAVRVPIDYAWLRSRKTPLSLVLRVGPYGGPFRTDDEAVRWLGQLARECVQEARAQQVTLTELQIDFDCADAKLDGYAIWLAALKRQAPGTPIAITALPSWLKQPAFRRLIAEADGYILQVHSLARPKGVDAPFNLCDPGAAREAVVLAGRLGQPFRVALPTYGYQLAFDGQGRFAGLSAEGPAREWPEDHQVREVRADASAMAALVREWTTRRPRAMQGLIWYRLPVAGDRLNWPWTTLAEVMEGRTPQTRFKLELREPQPGLVETELVNTGGTVFGGPVRAVVRWREARLLAADGLGGVTLEQTEPRKVVMTTTKDFARLDPGAKRTLGWLRLDRPSEVTLEMEGCP